MTGPDFLIKAMAAAVVVVFSSGSMAGPVSGQGTWETTLQARDLDGDGTTDAFYDTVLNVTWLRNANLNGAMSWYDATNWVNGYSIGGYSGWRLPKMIDTGPVGCDWSKWPNGVGTDCGFNVLTKVGDVVYSEFAHLFFETLGNKAAISPIGDFQPGILQPGYGLSNTGGFQNLLSGFYWYGLNAPPDANPANGPNAWNFLTRTGLQAYNGKSYDYGDSYAIAVRDGDVLAIPEPNTIPLFGIALVGLLASRSRKQQHTSGSR